MVMAGLSKEKEKKKFSFGFEMSLTRAYKAFTAGKSHLCTKTCLPWGHVLQSRTDFPGVWSYGT